MTPTDQLAWRIYCELSAGAMSARDYWDDLSDKDKAYYRREAQAVQFLTKQIANTVEDGLLKQMIEVRLNEN